MKIKKLSAPFSEAEIKQHWKYTDKVYISCVCITFNQKDYIRDAIDSFLAQETEYRFEIIIHDDVSTDGTRDILLEYKDKYPSLIKLVLQDENQYKLGKKITPLAVEHAEGEYIALCEGDDFWIDKQKLQKQVIELEKNKDVNICFTACFDYGNNNELNLSVKSKNIKIFTLHDVIVAGGGGIHTPTIMVRKSVFLSLPSWFYNIAPVGDYYFQILASKKAGAIFLPIVSSVYRVNSLGSWRSRRKSRSEISIKNEYINHIACFQYLGCDNKENISNLFFLQGYELLINKYFNSAYISFQKALKLNPKNIKVRGIYKFRSIYIVLYYYLIFKFHK